MKNTRRCALLAQLPLFWCAFMSCREYAPYSDEEIFEAEYQHNFIQTFGEVDPGQNWDFSACQPLTESISQSLTRADNTPEHPYTYILEDLECYYYVESDLVSNLAGLSISPEKARSFALLIGEGDYFDVYPVYQNGKAKCGFQWQFQAIVGNEDRVKSGSNDMGRTMKALNRLGSYEPSVLAEKEGYIYGGKSLPSVRCKSSDPRGLMYFNLLISNYNVSSNRNYTPIGSQQSSLNHQMKIVDLPKPANIGDDYDCLFVACEAVNYDLQPYPFDANNRFRSLIFMIVGPREHFPEVVYVQEEEDESRCWLETPIVNKRYMIEDLGSVSDFDFNDIVVDVRHRGVSEVNVTYERASYTTVMSRLVSLVDAGQETEAQITHLCGTRPFLLTVGTHQFPKVEDPMAAQLPIKSVVDGWAPEQNNISVTVWPNAAQSSEGGWSVSFPKEGQVPYIIAVPTWMPWTSEGERFVDWMQFVL